MTPNKNHSIAEQFVFGQVKSCPVVVNLKGEPVTSDAGLVNINCGTRQKKRNNITICKMFQRLPRPQ